MSMMKHDLLETINGVLESEAIGDEDETNWNVFKFHLGDAFQPAWKYGSEDHYDVRWWKMRLKMKHN